MSALVYAAPYIPPPPVAPPFVGYTMTWTGADGTVWPLDGSQGVLLLQEGLVGLHLPEYDSYDSTAPSTAGSRHRGSRAQSRPVEWNIFVYADSSSADWLDLDRAFWSSLDVDCPGVWTVTDVQGRAVSLNCRLSPKNDPYTSDPSLNGWALYNVQLVASDPFWYGQPQSTSWQDSSQVAFFDASGSPDFHISSSASFASATMSNPGDVETWPVWTITGPMASLTITVAGGSISIPALVSGDTLIINTDPAVATAFKNGTDVSGLVNPWDPRPIPKGNSVPMSFTASGTGAITATITPRFRRGI